VTAGSAFGVMESGNFFERARSKTSSLAEKEFKESGSGNLPKDGPLLSMSFIYNRNSTAAIVC
jgi:hypothetical protein